MTEKDESKVMEAVTELYPELIIAVEELQHRRIAGFHRTLPHWFYKLKKGTSKYKQEHKKQRYRKVSFCASRKETEIMKEVWNITYKDRIDFLTVHDAMLIDPADVKKTKDHLEQVLIEELGYLPFVKETQLSPAKAIQESKNTETTMEGKRLKYRIELLVNNHVDLSIEHSKEAA